MVWRGIFWTLLAIVAIVLAVTSCTVKQRRSIAMKEQLVWYDDTTANVRCYLITGQDGIACVKK